MASMLLVSCTAPWTVRPIGEGQTDTGQNAPFDAHRYVDSIWDAKVLTSVSSGVDLTELLGSASQRANAVLVKGQGRVLGMDTNSRARRLLIDAEPYDGHADAAVQIGPVIRGTTLRDALPFIQFNQFLNQLQFAQVGNALNDRVAAAMASLAKQDLTGRTVVFSGAAAEPSDSGLLEIVPVILTVKRAKP
jgi:predicted lipoprotein